MRPTLLPLLFVLACSSSAPPETYADFWAALQDRVCPVAEGDCAFEAEPLRCDTRDGVWGCNSYDPTLAAICLESDFECVDGALPVETRACDLVCEDSDLWFLTAPVPASCLKMLACDQAYASAFGVQPSFGGLEDPNYGPRGTCYRGDVEACATACSSAVDAYRTGLQAAVTAGTIPSVPTECL